MRSSFVRYELRTTDIEAARAFYAAIFAEASFWSRSEISILSIPERALAVGARPHWLGHIHVSDVEAMVRRLSALGGRQLGPTQQRAAATTVASVRDSFGTIIGLTSEEAPPSPPASPPSRAVAVAWHLMTVRDNDREEAVRTYTDLFGWKRGALRELGPLGTHQAFTFAEGDEEEVGSITNNATTSRSDEAGIHTQWLYFFRVNNLEEARAAVIKEGGLALPAIARPNGSVVAACDDPQGAAFGLLQDVTSLRAVR